MTTNVAGVAQSPGMLEDQGACRILVVEDDPAIRGLDVKLLRRAGFSSVDSAVDGMEGWEALVSRPYDLLITDLNMPRMSGAELIRRVRCAGMNLPIILATGAALEEEMVQEAWFATVSLLAKPFVSAELLGKVREVLAPQ